MNGAGKVGAKNLKKVALLFFIRECMTPNGPSFSLKRPAGESLRRTAKSGFAAMRVGVYRNQNSFWLLIGTHGSSATLWAMMSLLAISRARIRFISRKLKCTTAAVL